MACSVSPRGDFIYCLGEDVTLYCFGVVSRKLMPVRVWEGVWGREGPRFGGEGKGGRIV